MRFFRSFFRGNSAIGVDHGEKTNGDALCSLSSESLPRKNR